MCFGRAVHTLRLLHNTFYCPPHKLTHVLKVFRSVKVHVNCLTHTQLNWYSAGKHETCSAKNVITSAHLHTEDSSTEGNDIRDAHMCRLKITKKTNSNVGILRFFKLWNMFKCVYYVCYIYIQLNRCSNLWVLFITTYTRHNKSDELVLTGICTGTVDVFQQSSSHSAFCYITRFFIACHTN